MSTEPQLVFLSVAVPEQTDTVSFFYRPTSFVKLFDEFLLHAHVNGQILDPSLSNAGSKSRLPRVALLREVFLGP